MQLIHVALLRHLIHVLCVQQGLGVLFLHFERHHVFVAGDDLYHLVGELSLYVLLDLKNGLIVQPWVLAEMNGLQAARSPQSLPNLKQ